MLSDAFFLPFSLWAAYALRYYSTFWFNLGNTVDPQRNWNYWWLLFVIMLFGPLFLDLQGFYQSPLNKTQWKSFVQIACAMMGLSILASAANRFCSPVCRKALPL